jgi:hypothetical protein
MLQQGARWNFPAPSTPAPRRRRSRCASPARGEGAVEEPLEHLALVSIRLRVLRPDQRVARGGEEGVEVVRSTRSPFNAGWSSKSSLMMASDGSRATGPPSRAPRLALQDAAG